MTQIKFRGIENNMLIIAFIFLTPLYIILVNDFDITVKVTLIAEILIVTLLSFYYLYFDEINISNSIIIVFFLLFFIIAPAIQLGEHPIFLVNTLPYNEYNSFYINCLTILFLTVYLFTYTKYSRIGNRKLPKSSNQEIGKFFTFYLLLILSVISTYIALIEITELISSLNINAGEEEATATALLRKKVLYNIPIACLIYSKTLKFKNSKYRIFFIVILLLLVILTKNPVIERRSGLGPTYLMLLYLFLPNWFNTNSKVLVTFILIFVILFPLSSIFTHTSFNVWTGDTWRSLGKISFTKVIYAHFNSLHYDAWANVDSAVRFTTDHGYQYGKQLMGVIFFFVPRAIWETKPIATGHLVGEFLMNKFSMWFDNLSSPIVAEGYVDFGILGVIIFGIIAAIITHKINLVARSTDILKKYTAIYIAFSLMFVLRGSLMSSYAFICGSIFTFIYLPKIIDYCYLIVSQIQISMMIAFRNKIMGVKNEH